MKDPKDNVDLFRHFYEIAPLGYQSLDKNGCFIHVNQTWLNTLGYGYEEVIGRWFGDFLVPDYVDHFKKSFPRFKAAGEMHNAELHMVRKDGSHIIVSIDGRIAYDENGAFIQTHCILQDITDRKKTEKKLESAAEEWRKTFDAIEEMVSIIDKDYKILRVNNFFAETFNVHPKELIGKTCYEVVHGTKEPWPDCPHRKTIENKIKCTEEFFESNLGKYLEVSTSPVFNEENEFAGSVHIAKDITERKKVEKEIREARDFLESVLENSGDIIIFNDVEGKILYSNPAIERIYGVSRQEIIGSHVSMLSNTGEEFREKSREKMEELFEKGFISFEANHKTRNGRTIDVEGTLSMIKDDKENYTGGVAIIRDVTERKKMKEQLNQAQKMEAIGTMARGIAHDFNNILAIISGNAEMAFKKIPEANPARLSLEQISDACNRAQDLTRQILFFSSDTKNEKKPLHLKTLINETIKLLRSAIPSTIEIRHDLECESDTIIGDVTQINQVIMNLCTNAYQAMEASGGILEINLKNAGHGEDETSQCHDMKPGRYIKLSIGDTGEGIEAENIDRIFDPFFTTKDRDKGTGLGLSVVHGIVKQHGGDIKVESQRGRGSTFQILLPVAEEETKAEESAETTENIPSGKGNILVVDDEQVVAEMLKQMLEHAGYTVVVHTNSIEALETFRRQPDRFDLVITDQTMPAMTGEMLSKELLKIRKDIPIIISTGYSSHLTGEKIKEIGVKGLVMKPYKWRSIAQTVKDVLSRG